MCASPRQRRPSAGWDPAACIKQEKCMPLKKEEEKIDKGDVS